MGETVKLVGEAIVLFGVGGVIALERRCLGQMALAQPLLLCWLSGWISGQAEAGLWLGTCLQLFSLLPRRGLDWASAGLVAASALYLSPRLGFSIEVGAPTSVVLLLISAISILFTSEIERGMSRYHARQLAKVAPWQHEDPRQEVERFVRSALWRWWAVGTEVLALYTAVTLGAAALLSRIPVPSSWTSEIAAVGAPTLAMAVGLGSMARPRLLVWSLGGAAIGVGVLLI